MKKIITVCIEYEEDNNCVYLTRDFGDASDDFKRSRFILFKPRSS